MAIANRSVMFDPKKALNAILWVANRLLRKDFHRIFKVLYFADKYHLQHYGRLICGDTYIAMKDGPVPSAIYDMFKAVRGEGYSPYTDVAIAAFSVRDRFFLEPKKKADADLLSESDRESLDWAIKKYGRKTFGQLKDESHDEAWKKAAQDGDIDILDIARMLEDGEHLVEYLKGTGS
jgi:uncharacterized phage-associated protein